LYVFGFFRISIYDMCRMCSLAPPLLLVDQATPNMFDYANSTTTYSHHHTGTMANWSAFQLPSTIDTHHEHHLWIFVFLK
jgi:hypothetical protein